MKFKYQVLLIFLFALMYRVYSQNAISPSDKGQYKIILYYETGCDNMTRLLNNFTLSREDHSYMADSGICFVPEVGHYELVSSNFESLEKHIIKVEIKEMFDTISFSRIHIARSHGIPPWPYIVICGEQANGSYADYWPNGKPRISGKFKNGEVKKINIFNTEGLLVKRQINRKFRTLYEQYENNRLVLRYNRILFFKSNRVWNVKK